MKNNIRHLPLATEYRQERKRKGEPYISKKRRHIPSNKSWKNLFPVSAIPPNKHPGVHRFPWNRKGKIVNGKLRWIVYMLGRSKHMVSNKMYPQYGLRVYMEMLWYTGKYRRNPEDCRPDYVWMRR